MATVQTYERFRPIKRRTNDLNRAFQKNNVGYRNVDKDPTMYEVLQMLHESDRDWWEIAEDSGVALSTLYAWDRGKTKKPQGITLRYVAEACGYRLAWQPIKDKAA